MMAAHRVIPTDLPVHGLVRPRHATIHLAVNDGHALTLELYGEDRLLDRGTAQQLATVLDELSDEQVLALATILMPQLRHADDVAWLRRRVERFNEEMAFEDRRPEGSRKYPVTRRFDD